MSNNNLLQDVPVFLGHIESHAPLLTIPSAGQLLYKIMSVENLTRSVLGRYLHFNRVDSYSDFTGADPHDGRQLPKTNLETQVLTFKINQTLQPQTITTSHAQELTLVAFLWRTPTTFGATTQT